MIERSVPVTAVRTHRWSRGRVAALTAVTVATLVGVTAGTVAASGAQGATRTSAPAAAPAAAPDLDGDTVHLPAPRPLPADRLGDVLMARRTVRSYGRDPVGLGELSTVLAHGLADVRANRVLDRRDELEWLRSHGTAFDLFVVNYSIEGLAPGVHRYDIREHRLTLVRSGDLRGQMCSILVGMRGPESAAFTLVLAADFAQYQWRYRHERALRHLYMSVGRSGQRLLVAALGLGLGTLPTPATRDADTCALLGLDPVTSTPLYTLTMGPCRATPPGGRDD